MTEEDFEKEEEAYHIMKVFDQAICAARSRGGLIDEGNHIYFSQIGINGAMAQHCVNLFFEQENTVIKNNGILGGDYLTGFLKQMAIDFAGSSKIFAATKGMSTSTPMALLKGI